MNHFLESVRRFIVNLQRADIERRRRWLVASSAVSMVFVLVLWILYINTVIPSERGLARERALAEAPGFGDTLLAGLNAVASEAGRAVSRAAEWVGGIIGTKNRITIEGSEQ